MEGIVIITMDVSAMDVNARSQLDKEIGALGLQKTLPETEGGILHLPAGTYGSIIQLENQMDELKHYYRTLVGIMHRLNFKGRYFVNVAANPVFACGEL